MSTITVTPPRRATAQPQGETRILVPDASWTLYEGFVRNLPETSPIRTAFDGRDMEIMVKGPVHDHLAERLGLFVMAVAGQLGIRIIPQGETTWIRPEIERGIEADKCYYLDPEKIASALAALSRRVNDVAAYPNPDLAIEVDISVPKADRAGIYAALGVAELWIFDGETLTIGRLDEQGHYQAVQQSGFLRVRADQVPRWLTAEDVSDYDAWTRRVREWAEKELHGQ
jgi:Uma2 family endonuclease